MVLVIVRDHTDGERSLIRPDCPDLLGAALQVGAVPEGLAAVPVPGELSVVRVGAAPPPGDHQVVLPAHRVSDIYITGADQRGEGAAGAGGERATQGEVTSGVLRGSELVPPTYYDMTHLEGGADPPLNAAVPALPPHTDVVAEVGQVVGEGLTVHVVLQLPVEAGDIAWWYERSNGTGPFRELT